MLAKLQLKMGIRLGLSFGVLALAICVLASFSLLRMNSIRNVVHAQNEIRIQKLERLYAMRNALGQTGLAARNALIFTDDADALKELDILEQNKAAYLEQLNALVPLFKGDRDFEKVRTGLLAMATALERPRRYREANQMQEYGEFLVKECSPLRRQIVADIEVVLKALQSSVDRASHAAEDSLSEATGFIMLVSALGLLVGIVVGTLMTRSLMRQIGGEPQDVCLAANRVTDGNLAAPIPIRPGDETSIMAAMHRMQKSLQSMVGELRHSTDTIATGSAQIASGNADLSSRTEQQASSLEETASSMEELTSTVKQNADNARQANQLAATASGVAVKGGDVVRQVVTTMEGITESSKKIADIISVIDGIAFQTNILALNAAVEAARAGEQGRGFAVVATEVRNLAQRSAAAAKEIKELIGSSVEKVESGSALVGQAGTTMDEIVESVKRVTDIMAEITAASQEQSAGIEQVNQAIGQMDQVTQQNAALVEEAAAAAESLQEQAGKLAQAVSVFRFDESQIAVTSVVSRHVQA